MTIDKTKLYAALSAAFPEEAVERSQGRVTGRGYDTTGIKYQYIVNRLNDVLGIGGYRTQQKIDIKTGTTQKGRTTYDATCEVTLQLGEWKDGQFLPIAEGFSVGGHTSMSEADARKGAFTNGFKKAAAMACGVGRQAYEGTIDDDNMPSDDQNGQNGDRRPEPPSMTAPQQRPPENSSSQRPTAPVPTPVQRPQGPAESQTNSAGTNSSNSRNRLSTKQLGAIWALARKLNLDQRQVRETIKARYHVQPEFLDKSDASTIIGELSARAANGASHPAPEHQGAVA